MRARGADPSEIETALLRALDADPAHRPTLEALETIARDAKDDERLVNLLALGLDSATDVDAQAAPAGDRRPLRGPLARPAAALPYLEQLVALDPSEMTGREQLAVALLVAGRAEEAAQVIAELIAELGKAQPRQGHRSLADAARHHRRSARGYRRRGGGLRRRLQARSVSAGYHRGARSSRFGPRRLRVGAEILSLAVASKFRRRDGRRQQGRRLFDVGAAAPPGREIPKARNMFERGLEADPGNLDLKAALAGLA